MNEEIVVQIAKTSEKETQVTEEKKKITWLIFSIRKKKYALRSDDVAGFIGHLVALGLKNLLFRFLHFKLLS